jgi:GntR family transcriptional regulator
VFKMMDFFGDMIDKGLKPDSKLLSAKLIRPPKAISEILHVPQDKKVLRIKRILLADQIPFVLEEKYLLHEKCLRLREQNFQIAGNSFKFLDRCRNCWVKAEINMSARMINHYDAHLLRVSNTTIIFQLFKKVITFDNSPLCYIISRYRGDLFSFDINVFNYHPDKDSVLV